MLDGYANRQLELQKKHKHERDNLHNFHQQVRALVASRHRAEERGLRASPESIALRRHHQGEWAELTQSEVLSFDLLTQQQQQELADLEETYPLGYSRKERLDDL